MESQRTRPGLVSLLCHAVVSHPKARGVGRRRVNISYHIEGDHIAKGDFASLVSLDQVLVNENRTAAGWQAEYERSFICRIECLDAFYA